MDYRKGMLSRFIKRRKTIYIPDIFIQTLLTTLIDENPIQVLKRVVVQYGCTFGMMMGSHKILLQNTGGSLYIFPVYPLVSSIVVARRRRTS